jgi:beta-N-acetylhexosaminidase
VDAEPSPLARELALPAIVGLVILVAIVVALACSGCRGRVVTVIARRPAPAARAGSPGGSQAIQPARPRAVAPVATRPGSSGLTIPKALGQLIVSGFAGTQAPPTLLQSIADGQLGGVILTGSNIAGGTGQTAALTAALQSAARDGDNPGLLVMTDQEGGEVKRLPGPPSYPAAAMSDPTVAAAQGQATAQALHQAGVNVDLAPVADVARVDGFMAQEQRTFGSSPPQVADAACAFARALAGDGIAYTLKHFPGLGSALTSTDDAPVQVTEPANLIHADDLAYRTCGRDPFALVMVSSASYASLTGSTPAVMSAYTYHTLLPEDGVDAVTISDDFDTPAVSGLQDPAEHAINAGLDMVMYAGSEAAASGAYTQLLLDAHSGGLAIARIQAAARAVLGLKRALGLL